MTQQYDDTNRGALFRNNRKEQDSHPDHTGNINVDGKEFTSTHGLKLAKAATSFLACPSSRKTRTADKVKPRHQLRLLEGG